jgi:hypothetical protein
MNRVSIALMDEDVSLLQQKKTLIQLRCPMGNNNPRISRKESNLNKLIPSFFHVSQCKNLFLQ